MQDLTVHGSVTCIMSKWKSMYTDLINANMYQYDIVFTFLITATGSIPIQVQSLMVLGCFCSVRGNIVVALWVKPSVGAYVALLTRTNEVPVRV